MAVEGKGPKKKIPEGLWSKCPKCDQIIYNKELAENGKICSKCGYCYPLSAMDRVRQLLDEGTVKELDPNLSPGDPLEFLDGKFYKDKAIASQKKTGLKDAIWTGVGEMDGMDVVLGVMEFGFLGGSMGSVVGERLARAGEHALENKIPYIIVSTSGGARMHEGIFSLMQMAKVSAVLARLKEKGIPFISVLADPTTGGVTASFAMLGDVIYAEPGALVGFAGPRVIEQTIRQTLPEGFQRSEFLLKHGIIDRIIPRKELKAELRRTLKFFTANAAH
jgi:acetyl-CoA carboxylase carboxyl transferase subunit beta